MAEIYDKIEDYIKGRLSEENRKAFEAEMEADPGLAADVRLFRDLIRATGEEDVLAFRRQMEAAAEKTKAGGGSAGFRFPRRWLWALVAVAALGLIAWLFLHQPGNEKQSPGSGKEKIDTTTSALTPPPIAQEEQLEPGEIPPIAEEPDKTEADRKPRAPRIASPPELSPYLALAEGAYQPYDASGTRKGPGGEPREASPLERAAEAFSDSLYRQAVELLQTPPEEERAEWLKLRANAYFELRQFENAAADFEELSGSSRFYKGDADWNRLLCYLALWPEKQEEFEQLFNKIQKGPHAFQGKARELKERLAAIEKK